MQASLQSARNYYTESFPANVPTTVAKGAVLTGVIALISGASLNVIIIKSGASAALTITQAIACPLIKAIGSLFSDQGFLKEFVQISFSIIAIPLLLSTASPLMAACYASSNLFITFIGYFLLNSDYSEKNHAWAYVL